MFINLKELWKVKKIVSFFCICIFQIFNPAYAGSEVCPPASALPNQEALILAAKNAKDHGFLWQIRKDENTSYLYGTIHLARFENMFPGPIVKKALEDVDTVALELDVLDPDIMSRLVKSMSTTKGYGIPAELSKKIQEAAKAQCLPNESMANMMPELQVITLGVLQARKDGLYAEYGIDLVLSGFGHAAEKNMVSLESPEMQMEMLKMDSQQETVDFVRENLLRLESQEQRELTLRMFNGWESANYEDFKNYPNWCQCMNTEADKKYMQRLLDQRNVNLAKSIDMLHTSGKAVFVAVGSLHMFGEKNLPDLMRKHGYKVEVVAF